MDSDEAGRSQPRTPRDGLQMPRSLKRSAACQPPQKPSAESAPPSQTNALFDRRALLAVVTVDDRLRLGDHGKGARKPLFEFGSRQAERAGRFHQNGEQRVETTRLRRTVSPNPGGTGIAGPR